MKTIVMAIVPGVCRLKSVSLETEKESNSANVVSYIVGLIVFILALYLFLAFHLNNTQEPFLYKVLMFFVSTVFNGLYILYNLLFDTKNTVKILKNFGTLKSL